MEESTPSQPETNGDVEMTDAPDATTEVPTAVTENQPQPPLGRHASTGDSQPTLGGRQISEPAAIPFTSVDTTMKTTESNGLNAPEVAPTLPAETETPTPMATESLPTTTMAPVETAPVPVPAPAPAIPQAEPVPAPAPEPAPSPAEAAPEGESEAAPEPVRAPEAAPEEPLSVSQPAILPPPAAAPPAIAPPTVPPLSAGTAAAQATRFGMAPVEIANQDIPTASLSASVEPAAAPKTTGSVTAQEHPVDSATMHVASSPALANGTSNVAPPAVQATSPPAVAPPVAPSAPLPPPVHSPPAPTVAAAAAAPPSQAEVLAAAGQAQPAAPTQPPPAAPAAAAPQQPPPPPAGGGGFGGGGMRELRVEDALLYLDDVKREFGDRPRVYNEFLAIMKNFKSQEVDTPGVIARVSKLFRGYNNLILGFNKFLPDGYKISLADLQEADALYAREQEELRRQAAIAGTAALTRPGVGGLVGQPHAGIQAMDGAFAGQGITGVRVPGVAPPSAAIDGVAQGVARPGLPTSLDHVRRSPVDQLEQQRPRGPPGLGVTPRGVPFQQAPAPQAVPPQLAQAARPVVAQPQGFLVPTQRAAASQPQAQQPPQPAQQPQPPQQQAVEFDHAISYVTTIKRRFSNDPSIYHSFLEILHNYQKEQRGIKEVLEQVAHLFQDHPDLLKEFTFFLPDAVQEQAKERLHRAAADSEARQAARRAQLDQKRDDMDVDGKHRLIDMTGRRTSDQESGKGRKRSHKEALVQETAAPIVVPHQPESYVYNSAVERQFFDAAREALAAYTRDGGQAWAEFLKCLDMYAQEILSRSEMLNFVEPLLGKRNNKLFEEFKRIINSAGSHSSNAPNMEDSWYSVPLSEIDFSRCRRCTPSYRALPRDYPSPPCSDRSDEESKILNDVWVSLPVGSEESYTFRHMRRNTYEETLFRCEDERFEIDMAIDSNTATLALLEPIAEEIAQLAENELILPETSNIPAPADLDQGMAGKRFQYAFDKTILGVIHRNSIARIYGDAGQEMLDLIVKNPTVVVPLVVERLRQKDMEWRKVRSRLNKRWKELAEHNYYKSLDHRSLTWRATDKKAISTRTILSEIKDRAANDGHEGSVSLQARLDKAKEEHGSFFSVTMGPTWGKKMDLTKLPKPDRRLFTPHMSFMYDNTSWVHRDVYRILSFALERGSTSPADKERCHRMWFDFLGPWLNLTMDWMMTPAVKYQETTKAFVTGNLPRVVSNGVDSMADEDEEESADEDGEIAARIVTEDVRGIKHNGKQNSPSYMDHHPLPAGAIVSTVYGDGRIIECRRADDMYVVQLPFGKAFLRPTAVLCSIIPAEKSAYTAQLRAEDRTKLERPGDMLAIGTQSLYLFFRLHQILVQRLCVAKELAYNVKDDIAIQNMVEHMPGEDSAGLGKRRYDAFMGLLLALLDGHTLSGSAAEGGKYEDRVRSLLGHGAYALATMDKLISHILKNLQSMANDDTMWNLVQLHRRHLDSGSFKPEAFRIEAGHLSDGEQMYAFQMCPVQKDGAEKAILHMEYLGVIAESNGDYDATPEPAPVPQPPKRQRRER